MISVVWSHTNNIALRIRDCASKAKEKANAKATSPTNEFLALSNLSSKPCVSKCKTTFSPFHSFVLIECGIKNVLWCYPQFSVIAKLKRSRIRSFKMSLTCVLSFSVKRLLLSAQQKPWKGSWWRCFNRNIYVFLYSFNKWRWPHIIKLQSRDP